MAGRKRHPHKVIEAAIVHGEENGWKFVEPGNSSHTFLKARCPFNKDCPGSTCQFGIWSTPKDPENFAKRIYRNVDQCEELAKKRAAQAAVQEDQEEN